MNLFPVRVLCRDVYPCQRRVAARAAGAMLALLLGCGGCGGGGSSSGIPAPGQPGSQGNAARPGTAAGTPTVLHWTYPDYVEPGPWDWKLPPHMPEPRVPADNPMNAAKVALGRHLFHDRRLSGDGRMSCASCHEQARAFADGKARPTGITGVMHPRNAMGLGNVAWNATQTWANPALLLLEAQIPNPVFGTEPVEMGVNDGSVNTVLERLKAADDVDYPTRFAQAFPEAKDDPLTWENVFKAISAFERTMITADSRYDRHLQGRATLTAQELHGRQLFEQAGCTQCHRPPNFDDQFVSAGTKELKVQYHNIGLYNLNGRGDYPAGNTGAEEITGNAADMGAFRVPSLRNVAMTGPYMHDGSVATLEEAVAIMAGGGRNIASGPRAGDGRSNPYKSPLVRDRGLSAQEREDIVAFLRTLTDETFLNDPALSDPFRKGGQTSGTGQPDPSNR